MSALSETAKLVSQLDLKDNFTPQANKAMKSLGRMESTGFRVGQNIGKGFNNAAKNLQKLAKVGIVAAAGALTGALALGVRSLGDLARTTNQTEAVIKSTGGAAKVTAAQVRDMANNLENLSTVDDKVIQDGENMLLTFTNIGNKVFPKATKAALDMALAMAGGNVEAVDLKASSIQLGKALNNPVKGITALQKVGVSFTDVQKKTIAQNSVLSKQETKHYVQLLKTNKKSAERYKNGVLNNKLIKSQTIILDELNKEFGKSSEAAGKGPEAVMRRLKDAGEDVSQILARATLPVLERLGTFLTTKLADPAFLKAVDDFGSKLGEAGGKFLDFIEKVDFTAIGNALKIGADAAGTIVGAFLNAPTWLQEAIVTGWGLNKISGGAITGIFGELASGLIKGVLGINAGIVNVNAASVASGGLPVSPAGGGSWTSLFSLIGPAAAAAIGTYLVTQEANTSLHSKGITQSFQTPGAGVLPFGIDTSIQNLATAITILTKHQPDRNNLPIGGAHDEANAHNANTGQKTAAAIKDLDSSIGNVKTENQRVAAAVKDADSSINTMKGKIADDLAANQAAITNAGSIGARASTTAGQVAAVASAGAGSRVVSAIWAARPIVNTFVNVSSTTVQQKYTVVRRAGPASGDRNQHGPTEFDS